MSFRLVPKSVTLNDLERRNGSCFALFQRIRIEDTPKLSATEMYRKAASFQRYITYDDNYDVGNPSVGGVKRDFGPIEGRIRGKLVLITNRSFRLVPKSVTLNDLERRNGRCFALFQRIRQK